MDKDVPIFNPLSKDVIVNYDTSSPNPRTWVLRAKEITKVEHLFAKHIKRALVDEMFNVKGNSRIAHDIQEKEFYKEIEI